MFDLFWKDDISILYNVDRLTEFFPSSDMNFDEKLNALVRLCTYAGVLLYLYHRNKDYLYLPIIMMGASLFLHKMSSYERNEHFQIVKKNVDPKKFTLPTVNNPFMNYNVMSNNVNKKPAADIESVKQDINNKFDEGLYKNVDDVFDKTHSNRQYFTMPWTGASNKQGDFSKWLYNDVNNTCKVDQDKCGKSIYEDLRASRPVVQ